MQDLLIGRHAQTRSQSQTVNSATGFSLRADAKRIAVHVAQATPAGIGVVIRTGGTTGPPLAYADQFPGSVSIDVRTHGQAVMGELTIMTNSGAGVTCGINEVILPDDNLPSPYYNADKTRPA